MDRLPYGASCSQLVAIYTIRQIVQDAGLAEHIAIAVRERIYVDDFLRSAPTVVEALSEATSVKSALANADGLSELHVFCDASEEVYAAVIYIHNVYSDSRTIVRQGTLDNRLAPKKVISVPKLELNAALLGSRLAVAVQSAETVSTEGCVPETDVDVDPQYKKTLAVLLNECTNLFVTKDSDGSPDSANVGKNANYDVPKSVEEITNQSNTEDQLKSEYDYEHDLTEQNNIMEDMEGESSGSQSGATSTPPSVTVQTFDDMLGKYLSDVALDEYLINRNALPSETHHPNGTPKWEKIFALDRYVWWLTPSSVSTSFIQPDVFHGTAAAENNFVADTNRGPHTSGLDDQHQPQGANLCLMFYVY
ncbi:hypothetical protein OUZ56_032700 [Daphnia magna]|uniref:Reverse transcriptase/retrotransposon-derived protein RNase H-like domain-containing protein n=1 Tax=Daphnia magna TaxID=35525 RepID=A0ABQ9ZWW3_9CRUS|nr:hypothetical protein OUZ56_032700 [Daphnia magna]